MTTPKPITALWDYCWNQRDYDKIDTTFTEDLKIHAFGVVLEGRDAVREIIQSTIAGFSDMHQYLDHVFLGNNNMVTTVWHGTGTHDGVFHEVPPTNKQLTYHGICVFRLDGERIAEAWLSSDMDAQLSQL